MEQNNNYSIYIHIFPNGKVYVGLTRINPCRRWGTTGNGYKGQYVYKAIEKYGWENIKHIILHENLSLEEACSEEQELIEHFDSIRNGYNCSSGGETKGGCPKYYDYKGKRYSIYEMLNNPEINIYNITYDCAKWRLGKGWSVEDVFIIPQPGKYHYYEYKGKKYNLYELAEISDTGITPHGIQTRISRGYTVEEAVETPLMEKTMFREYQGEYYTISELVDKFGDDSINSCDLICRLNRGWDIERALTQPKGTKRQPFGIKERTYEYEGKMYNSYELSQIHPELGLTSLDITTRVNSLKWDIKRAITQPKKKTNLSFEYNGKKYNSHELAQICVDDKMTYHDITDRGRNGWTTWEIVNIPKGITKKRFYKNIE